MKLNIGIYELSDWENYPDEYLIEFDEGYARECLNLPNIGISIIGEYNTDLYDNIIIEYIPYLQGALNELYFDHQEELKEIITTDLQKTKDLFDKWLIKNLK